MTGNFGLRIQLLPAVVDRVLVVGDLVGLRNGDGWFTAGEVSRLFEALRLPPPGNVSQSLKRLEDRQHALRRTAGGWGLTPLGKTHVLKVIGDLDPAQVAVQIGAETTAELGHVQHPLIPPQMAPQRWLPAIVSMLDDWDFDQNVFCMTRYPRDVGDDVLAAVIGSARDTAHMHGMTLQLASDRMLDDDLWGNVAAHMWACRYGVALFEQRATEKLNENLLIEVGSMLVTGRRCALLRDRSVMSMPTDFVGQIYKPVDFDDVDSVSVELHTWLAVDLGLGTCASCPATSQGKDDS